MVIVKKLLLNKLIGIICVFSVIMLMTACGGAKESSKEIYYKPPRDAKIEMIDTKGFIKENDFYTSVNKAKKIAVFDEVLGGVAPHHNVASYMMGDFFETIAAAAMPDIIFMIGPNHFGKDRSFQVGKYNFDTYNRVVECDLSITETLANNELIKFSEKSLFENEHSLNILINYVGQYFEEAKVVAFLVGDVNNSSEFEAITDAIYKATYDKNCLFIASIDFSHYLTLEEAEKNDEITRELLLTMDKETLIQLNNGYIDCPLADLMMLEVLEKKNNISCEILDHNNMANILNDSTIKETTSYFTVVYGK